MTLKETFHDFGDVRRLGGDLVYDFAYTNTGSVPLVVIRTQTSCSCLKVNYPRKPLQPGQSARIRVIYETHKAEAGAFSKVIQIYSNSRTGRELITIKGNSL